MIIQPKSQYGRIFALVMRMLADYKNKGLSS